MKKLLKDVYRECDNIKFVSRALEMLAYDFDLIDKKEVFNKLLEFSTILSSSDELLVDSIGNYVEQEYNKLKEMSDV